MNRSTLAVTLSTLASIAALAGCGTSHAGDNPPVGPRACKPRATAAETYMLAWNTAERDVRRCLLSAVWSERGRYVDPSADVTGVDALVDHIGGYLRQFPGTRLEPTSPVVTHHDVVHFTWRVVAGTKTMLEGKDFGRIDGDGKFLLIAGFFPTAP